MNFFQPFTRSILQQHTRIRRFETKLGEKLLVPAQADFEQSLAASEARFVVIGVCEDIGVIANYGQGGSHTAFWPFVNAFCNLQSNEFFDGGQVMMGGWLDFAMLHTTIDANALNQDELVDAYRHAVNTIDDAVEEVMKRIVRQGKVPIIIGGGHNNAYPVIKGAAKGLQRLHNLPLPQINVVNLDAHADYRPAEGRHSGNGFRYAEEDGFLLKYCVIGLLEAYVTQNQWLDLLNNPFFDCITWEDIFLHEKHSFRQAVLHALAFTEDSHLGLELDLDAVEGVLASAQNASGVEVAQARLFVHLCAQVAKPAYLHLSEAAAQLSNGQRNETAGKLLAQLVTDFVKAWQA